MSERMKPLLAALVTAYILFFLGTRYLFAPAIAADAPAGPLMPSWASLAVAAILSILFFDWINQSMKNPLRSALTIAIAQILLVDVYYVMNGIRGAYAAGISIVVLVVGWAGVGFVYNALSGGAGGAASASPTA